MKYDFFFLLEDGKFSVLHAVFFVSIVIGGYKWVVSSVGLPYTAWDGVRACSIQTLASMYFYLILIRFTTEAQSFPLIENTIWQNAAYTTILFLFVSVFCLKISEAMKSRKIKKPPPKPLP